MSAPVLNETNGDCAVERLQHYGIKGSMLPWRDVLHEGPVPGNVTRASFCETRAAFLGQTFKGHIPTDIAHGLANRYSVIEAVPPGTRIILWFEPDLYDQLQLIEVLHTLCGMGQHDSSVWLQDQSLYWALTTDDDLDRCAGQEVEVPHDVMGYAAKAWDAFRDTDPRRLQDISRTPPDALPFFSATMGRFFCEYPHPDTGLTLTEHRALHSVAAAPRTAGQMFGEVHKQEEAPFMGDTTFFAGLERLRQSQTPLLKHATADTGPIDGARLLSITEQGARVLDGQYNWHGDRPLDMWRGGVHITHEHRWTFSPDTSTFACP